LLRGHEFMAETWSVKISQESKFSTINKRVYDQKNNKEIKFTVLLATQISIISS
jgi:hypothetical protein